MWWKFSFNFSRMRKYLHMKTSTREDTNEEITTREDEIDEEITTTTFFKVYRSENKCETESQVKWKMILNLMWWRRGFADSLIRINKWWARLMATPSSHCILWECHFIPLNEGHTQMILFCAAHLTRGCFLW